MRTKQVNQDVRLSHAQSQNWQAVGWQLHNCAQACKDKVCFFKSSEQLCSRPHMKHGNCTVQQMRQKDCSKVLTYSLWRTSKGVPGRLQWGDQLTGALESHLSLHVV